MGTPWHPVRMGGKWMFPSDLSPACGQACEAVYSFVFTDDSPEHVMLINGIQCVTLGHGYTEEVVGHPYFGSRQIVRDLAQMSGWDAGVVQFDFGCMVRSPVTHLL